MRSAQLSLIEGHGSNGGGIFNDEHLTVEDCTLSGNWADNSGGGIYNSSDGILTVTHSTLANNSAGTAGGGIVNEYYATATVTDSVLANNSAGWGGGIYNQYGTLTVANTHARGELGQQRQRRGIFSDGTLTVTDSVLEGNSAADTGGGICSYDNGTGTVTNSTLANNTAGHSGGGILNLGTLTITNSTLANNSVKYFGGGILNNMTALLTLTNSTLAANFAGSDGGGIMNWATLSVTNSLFGNNTAPTGPDVNNSGTIADARYNVVYQGSASGIVNGVNGNQVGVDPLLDPAGLQDNGGPTQTFALLPGSPHSMPVAIDQAVGPDGQPLAYDQRGPGFPRILGGTVDVGALSYYRISILWPIPVGHTP